MQAGFAVTNSFYLEPACGLSVYRQFFALFLELAGFHEPLIRCVAFPTNDLNKPSFMFKAFVDVAFTSTLPRVFRGVVCAVQCWLTFLLWLRNRLGFFASYCTCSCEGRRRSLGSLHSAVDVLPKMFLWMISVSCFGLAKLAGLWFICCRRFWGKIAVSAVFYVYRFVHMRGSATATVSRSSHSPLFEDSINKAVMC